MSQLNVDTIRNRTGGPPSLDKGAVVTGIVTATSGEFSGDVTVGGVLTYEDVTNIDSTGIVTAKGGIRVGNPVSPGIGATIDPNGNAIFAGIVTAGIMSATTLYGDGSQLTGIDATAIQTGNTSVQTVDTGTDGHIKLNTEGSERVRVGQLGQIGLGGQNYGDSGQVMTSGGIGAAPTWTTPSSAPEVSGTANGAIAAGKPVVANADGSIGQVKYTYTELGTYLNSNTSVVISNGYNAEQVKVAWDTTNDQALYFWRNTNDSNAGEITIGTITGDIGSNVRQSSNQRVHNGITKPFQIAWSKTSAVGVALYTASGGMFIEAFTSNGSSLTFGTRITVCTSNSTDWGTVSWDASADKFLVVVGKDASDSNYANAWVVSHSGTTLTLGTKVQVKASEAEHASLSYDSDNNRHLLCYSDYQDSEKLCGRIITVSGTTPTVGAETKLTDANNYGVSTAYITGGKFITYYNRSNDGYARIITISGTTVSFGAESSNIESNQLGGIGNDGLGCAYDTATGKVGVVYRKTSGTYGVIRYLTLDTSANTISAISNFTYLTGNGTNASVSITYIGGTKLMFVTGFKKSNNNGGTVTYTTATATSNITGENYLGVANASYTNGQTATIRVSGATQDNQTGLTPGQNYFVQNDGSLGLTAATPTVYAGTAVSSTQLLVGKESAAATPGLSYVTSFIGDQSTAHANYAIKFEDLDWTNVSYYLFQMNGLAFNGESFSVTQPEIQLKAGSSWVTSSVYYTYADWASWNNSWAQNNQSAVAARPWVNQTAGDWTGEIYISRSSTYNTNNGNGGANKYMWGRAFSNARFSNWQCNLTASQFREEEITGIRFGNSYGYTMGYHGTIDVFKYYSGRA